MAKVRSTLEIIEEQMQRWQFLRSEKKKEKEAVSVITLSREPGSGGRIIAERLANTLQFAPLKVRVQNVSNTFAIPIDEVKRRIIKTDSDRKAFVRNYFNADVSDPKYYDLTINTEHLSVEAAVEAIGGAFGRFRQKNPN